MGFHIRPGHMVLGKAERLCRMARKTILFKDDQWREKALCIFIRKGMDPQDIIIYCYTHLHSRGLLWDIPIMAVLQEKMV